MKNQLWELCKKIYAKADNREDFVKKCNDYWSGDLAENKIAFDDQDKTAFNVIKPILETKLKAVLDAEFSLAVVPSIKSFASLKTIKDQQAVADIYNDELLNILNNNNMDSNKEKIARDGLKCGFGSVQVLWNDEENNIGEVKIKSIPSQKLRWDKGASSVCEASFIGYSFSMSPNKAKKTYALDEEGNYDERLCRKIDNIASSVYHQEGEGNIKGIVNYTTTSGSGQMYSRGAESLTDGIAANKNIDLVCLFLEDNSFYAPDEKDDKKEEVFKKEQLAKYPNGRMIIFSLNEKEKLILKDEALPKSFNSLGNVAVFNPIQTDSIAGFGEVEDLMQTQNRIDGLYHNYRKHLNTDFTMLAMEKNGDIAGADVVKHPVFYMKPDSATPVIVSNGGMAKAEQSLGMITQLEQHAAKMARVNETMIYGQRQTGTTSSEQVKSLQESPLADIRSIQRNFKDFYINIGNKCLDLIKKNYTVDRLIRLSTGMTDAAFATLQTNSATGEQEMALINEAGEAVKTIKMNEDWEFCVEVSAGTAVPRTRKEQGILMDSLIDRGILNMQDPDFIEEYLKAQDVPNYRMLIKLLRDKQQAAQEQQNHPEAKNWKELVKNTDIAKVVSDFIKSINGYPLAQQHILNEIGLPANPGKLDTTPVSEITSQSDVAEVATMANIISDNPDVAMAGRDAAIAEQLTDIS